MIQARTISFYTLGCKLNFAESAAIARIAENSGYEVLKAESIADIAVINTCSVTDNADKKCRKLVKEILTENHATQVVVIGCYAQLKPTEISSIPGVSLVLGAAEKFKLPFHLKSLNEPGRSMDTITIQEPISEDLPFHTSWSSAERTRSFLKVQDGCDYVCSFCTIPLARGSSRNGSIEDIVAQAIEIANTGISEIVLTGVNIGDFGKTTGESFLALIKALDEVEGVSRFRISSIEPNLLLPEIIDFVASSKRFVPHFHIPLQSGSNRILGSMRRRYKRELYASRVEQIRKQIPDCCIGVDVIVGFPGESDEDFNETYQFLHELDISYLHIFSYSERDNTPASSMPMQVNGSVKASRSRMLHSLSEKKRRAFYESQLGRQMDVMFEMENKNGLLFGFTPNYVKVCRTFEPRFVKELVTCTLSHIQEDGAVFINPTKHVPNNYRSA